MNSTPGTVPCTSSTTATGACAAAGPVRPAKTTTAANMLFIPETSLFGKSQSRNSASAALFAYFVAPTRTAGRSEAHANHGVTASAASASTPAYDAGSGKDLLACAGCFRPCSPWLFALGLAVRLFAARPRIVLVVV